MFHIYTLDYGLGGLHLLDIIPAQHLHPLWYENMLLNADYKYDQHLIGSVKYTSVVDVTNVR